MWTVGDGASALRASPTHAKHIASAIATFSLGCSARRMIGGQRQGRLSTAMASASLLPRGALVIAPIPVAAGACSGLGSQALRRWPGADIVVDPARIFPAVRPEG